LEQQKNSSYSIQREKEGRTKRTQKQANASNQNTKLKNEKNLQSHCSLKEMDNKKMGGCVG